MSLLQNSTRHIAKVRVAAEMLAEFFREGWNAKHPERPLHDVKVLGATYDQTHETIDLIIEAPSLPAVGHGDPIPEYAPLFERVDE